MLVKRVRVCARTCTQACVSVCVLLASEEAGRLHHLCCWFLAASLKFLSGFSDSRQWIAPHTHPVQSGSMPRVGWIWVMAGMHSSHSFLTGKWAWKYLLGEDCFLGEEGPAHLGPLGLLQTPPTPTPPQGRCCQLGRLPDCTRSWVVL